MLCSHGEVHPHVRGDNQLGLVDYEQQLGSPPRAWGQPVKRLLIVLFLRFTPTCVGTTPNSFSFSTVIQVHPHVRGDNLKPNKGRWVVQVHPHVRGDN